MGVEGYTLLYAIKQLVLFAIMSFPSAKITCPFKLLLPYLHINNSVE